MSKPITKKIAVEVAINRIKMVAVRFGPLDFAALEKYAAKDRRAVSTAVWMIVTDLLKAEGLIDATGRDLYNLLRARAHAYKGNVESRHVASITPAQA